MCLQGQRLPTEVLMFGRDRIAYALSRAIEGELGKEGKKGSVADGLRVSCFQSQVARGLTQTSFRQSIRSHLENLLCSSRLSSTQISYQLSLLTCKPQPRLCGVKLHTRSLD